MLDYNDKEKIHSTQKQITKTAFPRHLVELV